MCLCLCAKVMHGPVWTLSITNTLGLGVLPLRISGQDIKVLLKNEDSTEEHPPGRGDAHSALTAPASWRYKGARQVRRPRKTESWQSTSSSIHFVALQGLCTASKKAAFPRLEHPFVICSFDGKLRDKRRQSLVRRRLNTRPLIWGLRKEVSAAEI